MWKHLKLETFALTEIAYVFTWFARISAFWDHTVAKLSLTQQVTLTVAVSHVGRYTLSDVEISNRRLCLLQFVTNAGLLEEGCISFATFLCFASFGTNNATTHYII